jgi:hypothetical protein
MGRRTLLLLASRRSPVYPQTSAAGPAALPFGRLGMNVTRDDKNSVNNVSPGAL